MKRYYLCISIVFYVFFSSSAFAQFANPFPCPSITEIQQLKYNETEEMPLAFNFLTHTISYAFIGIPWIKDNLASLISISPIDVDERYKNDIERLLPSIMKDMHPDFENGYDYHYEGQNLKLCSYTHTYQPSIKLLYVAYIKTSSAKPNISKLFKNKIYS